MTKNGEDDMKRPKNTLYVDFYVILVVTRRQHQRSGDTR